MKRSAGARGKKGEGVDFDQVKTLFRISLKLDFRTDPAAFAKGKKTSRAFIWAVLFPDFLTSFFLGVFFFRNTDLGAYSALILGISMTLIAMAVLVEYHQIIVSPLDAEILGALPVSSRTFFAARLANILFYVTAIGLALHFLPSLFGTGVKGSGPAFIPVFLLVSWLAVLWAAAFVVLVFAILVRWINLEKVKDLLAYIQLGLLMVTIVGYQFIPRFLDLAGKDRLTFSFHQPWSLLLPPAWFAGLASGIMEGFDTPRALQAALALISLALLWILAAGKISLEYSAVLLKASEKTDGVEFRSPGKKGGRTFGARIRSLFVRPGPEEVGFELAARYFKRDRGVRNSLLTGFIIPIPFLFLALLDKGFKDPLAGDLSFYNFFFLAYLSMPGILFPFNLPNAEDWKASWIFWAAPLEDPAGLFRGAFKLFLARYLLPYFGLLFLAFCFLFPAFHAFLVILVVLAFTLNLAAAASLFWSDHPFCREPRRNAAAAKIQLAVFGVLSLMFLSAFIQTLLFRNPRYIPYALAFLLGLFALLRFLGDYRLEQKLEKSEYYG